MILIICKMISEAVIGAFDSKQYFFHSQKWTATVYMTRRSIRQSGP